MMARVALQARQQRRAVLALTLAAALGVAACSGGEPDTQTASPTPEVSASAMNGPSASPSSTDADASPSPSTSTTDDPSDDPTDPTDPSDTDRARFVSSYRPDGASDLEHVQVDLDGDGVDELVFSYVRGGEKVGHVDLADWDAEAGAYAIVAGADGGVADRIDRVRVGDLNADGFVEVALFQATGSSGSSVTLWRVQNSRLVPLRARGGCWDGSSTYGVTGARIADTDGDGISELFATCDDSPLPVAAWSTDGYRWQDGAWVHDPEL